MSKGEEYMESVEGLSTLERMIIKRAKQTDTPVNGSIELLPLCNMNCDMCYIRLSREDMERQGKMRTADEWLELGSQMKEAGVLFLLLTGGEPFLHPDFKKIYLGLREMGMIITINTNGTLIDADLAGFLGKYKPRRVNVTLYGTDKKTYTELCHYPDGYRRTMRGISLLCENGVDVKIGGSLTKANRNDLNRLLDIGEELDIPVRVDTYMMPATRERKLSYNLQSRLNPEDAAKARVYALKREMGEELFEQYVRQALKYVQHSKSETARDRHMSCMAGRCSFTVNWQGEMRPCVVMNEPSISVFEVGFEKAWEYISEVTSKILLNEKCSFCCMRHLCRTCAACALLETGGYDGVPEYMCRYTEETLRLLRKDVEMKQEAESDAV